MPTARPRAHGSMKVGSSWCFRGSSEERCIGQDEKRRRQEEEPQGAPCAPPQAQVRDDHAQEDSILHEIIPQVIQHVDCEIWYNFMFNRYKAKVNLNGVKVQEMFAFSLHELKERLRQKISKIDATSSSPLTKAVQWTSEPVAWNILRLFRYKQLKQKTLFLLAQNRTLDQKVCTRDPVYRIPCFDSQGTYYYRPYCHIMCRRSTVKAMRDKVIQF